MNNIKVGYQRLVGKKPPLPVTKKELIPLLECMATKLKDETLAIRNEKDKDRQAQLKKDTLPAIIISAATTCRKASDDDERTGLILIDLDDFGGKANPDVTHEQAVQIVDSMIGEYPFVIGRHTSVRRGLKVACGIEPSVDSHKRSFAALRKLFADHGLEVDRSTSDEKRANFLCWDADIIETLVVPLKRWMGEFIEPLAEPEPAPTSSPTLTAHTPPSGMSADEEAVICLSHLNPDMDYGDWLATGMACHSHGASMSTWVSKRSGLTMQPSQKHRSKKGVRSARPAPQCASQHASPSKESRHQTTLLCSPISTNHRTGRQDFQSTRDSQYKNSNC